MKKLSRLSIDEKLKKLDQLSDSNLKETHGGVGGNDSIPPKVTFTIPPVTPPPPYTFTIKPPGGGVTCTF